MFILCFQYKISRDGAVVRALTFHQCGLGSIPGPGVMWVEFVVGSRPSSKGFPPSIKTNIFQIPIPPAYKAHLNISI